MLSAILTNLIVVLISMSVWYLVSVYRNRIDFVDVGWGAGFILVAIVGLFYYPTSVYLTLLVLIGIWGLRLIFHLLPRIAGNLEDPRYGEFRKKWGKDFLRKAFINVFALQGILIIIVSLPVIGASLAKPQIGRAYYIGLLIWLGGFMIEAIADWQLAKYKKKKRGAVLNTGLWRYSRHPNYFGEITMWWGIWLLSSGFNIWYTVIGPIAITLLIVYVSGIPPMEKRFVGNKEYERYKNKTSPLIPWLPKR